jgi:lipoprotein-anchoring transpeptidase ErfK/SrfK
MPLSLKSLWHVGTINVVLEGALMRFQYDHGLTTTGAIDTPTWNAIITAAIHHGFDRLSYNYVVVSKNSPQSLRLYVDGRQIYTSPVNTGISVAPTQSGTFPVYLRYTTTTMSGTLPNGQSYHDSGIPWVSYFNGGDALHGFIRASYGWPQSLGCVEMPFANAKIVWPRTPIGTLVTVNG